MIIKKYKVIQKDGKSAPHLFESVSDALRTISATKIKKIEEVNYEEEVSETTIDKKNFILISRKTDKEIEHSNNSGYAATYSRPALTKVFKSMPVLEVGETLVLESKISAIGRYDNVSIKNWGEDNKEWEWAVYHLKGNILTIDEAKKKYGDFDKALGRDGTIVYTPKLK